jgi:autotransporter strand-loop-strand O-heptosyltransferase
LGKHTIMISNFTEAGHEFSIETTRITNPNVCHGCWNNKNFKFDKGNWNWCPIYEGYERQFECQKSILPESVIGAIKELSL